MSRISQKKTSLCDNTFTSHSDLNKYNKWHFLFFLFTHILFSSPWIKIHHKSERKLLFNSASCFQDISNYNKFLGCLRLQTRMMFVMLTYSRKEEEQEEEEEVFEIGIQRECEGRKPPSHYL